MPITENTPNQTRVFNSPRVEFTNNVAVGGTLKVTGSATYQGLIAAKIITGSTISGSTLIAPTANNVVDLGTGKYQFKDLYLTGSIYCSGSVVSGGLVESFQFTTATGSILQLDYLTGSVISGSNISGTAISGSSVTSVGTLSGSGITRLNILQFNTATGSTSLIAATISGSTKTQGTLGTFATMNMKKWMQTGSITVPAHLATVWSGSAVTYPIEFTSVPRVYLTQNTSTVAPWTTGSHYASGSSTTGFQAVTYSPTESAAVVLDWLAVSLIVE